MTMPCAWDVSCEVCPGFADYDDTIRDTSLWLASTILWAATGRRFGVCPVTVRPLQPKRGEVVYQDFPVLPGHDGLGRSGGPFLFSGRWFNAGCVSACCGNSSCAIVLRGPVASVSMVLVDGEVVLDSAYRVDVVNGVYLLVRIDGECWPACQNMSADVTETGTFEVTYGVGTELPPALMIATALLACEYAKHLNGAACSLPAKMTRLSRQGVEVEVAAPDAVAGSTGIKMVDEVIHALNPGRRQAPPRVMSPDLPETCDRYTVISAGS